MFNTTNNHKTRFSLRLIFGHTHEDIDAKFAAVWKKIRDAHVLTPLQWKDAIEKNLTNEKMKCNVHDIYCVPDYVRYLAPHMHTISRYAKGKWTQLQFFFDRVENDPKFPTNVKITYRAYSADRVARLIPCLQHPTG